MLLILHSARVMANHTSEFPSPLDSFLPDIQMPGGYPTGAGRHRLLRRVAFLERELRIRMGFDQVGIQFHGFAELNYNGTDLATPSSRSAPSATSHFERSLSRG